MLLTKAAFYDLSQKIERRLNQKEFTLNVFLVIDEAIDYFSTTG
jgi:hypothetical protein